MTVSMQVTKRIYQGNGVTRQWDVDFPLIAADNLGVYLTSPQGAEEEVFTDFTVDPMTHTLTYPTPESGKSPLGADWKLTVLRRTPLTQEIDLLRQGELDAEVLEEGYDKLTMLVQELGEKVDRSIKYPVSSKEEDLETENFLKNILAAKEDAVVASSQAAEAARQAQAGASAAQQTAADALQSISSAVTAGCETLAQNGAEIIADAQACVNEAEAQAETARRYAEGSIGKCMGEVYWSQSKALADNPGSLPLWTGAYYATASSLYPDFYAWVKEHAELCTTKADYDARLEQYGECPFYVADEAAGSLRLPKLTRYVKNANETDGITQAQEGLPNITAKMMGTTYGGLADAYVNASGACRTEGSGGAAAKGGEEIFLWKHDFDASRSSAVYGRSDAVTPAHTTLYPWVCVYHTAVPQSVADAAQLLGAFTAKADTDLANISGSAKTAVSALSKASETYIEGIFPAIDTTPRTFTAPANGYICVQGYTGSGNSTFYNVDGVLCGGYGCSVTNIVSFCVPVKQGQVTTVHTDTVALTLSVNRFVYDQGANI